MAYTISDFRRDIRQPFAWPGGYPRYFVTNDGAACDINWENPDLYCDHSGKPIPSAYGED